MLTIMSSLAQEESRSISENVTWGKRKSAADGKISLGYKQFLGYDKGEKGSLVVNPEQAVLVKRIYREFMQGTPPWTIAHTFSEEKIPTPSGKSTNWRVSVIESILTNTSDTIRNFDTGKTRASKKRTLSNTRNDINCTIISYILWNYHIVSVFI